MTPPADAAAALAATRLLVVSGKGGVGKTVVAAALATVLARRGRRVLLLEADPRDSLHHLFGAEPSGGGTVRAADRLDIQNASPRAILDGVVRDRLKVRALSSRVLASPVYQHFAEGAPGLKEMMLLGYAMEATEGRQAPADVVVLDAPASGHGLALLAAPQLVSGVITTGPLGTMARRIAAFVSDPERCAVVLATLAEESPVTETLETASRLAGSLGRPVDRLVVNQLWPEAGPAADELWIARRRMNEREVARLEREWPGAIARLPLVGADFGPVLLEELAAALAAQLPEAPTAAAAPARRRRRGRP